MQHLSYSQHSSQTIQHNLFFGERKASKMATSAGRGAQTMNSMYFKPMLRKAFHRKSGSPPDIPSDATKLNGEEMKNKNMMANHNQDMGNWWIPDDRTGIFYPKGQEKVMEDVPSAAGRDLEPINWFSNHDTYV